MQFWVDFSGYACVEAETKEEADEKMRNVIHKAFDGREVFDDVWDIDEIEERVDSPLVEDGFYEFEPGRFSYDEMAANP